MNGPVAAYRILSRILAVASGQHLVVVSVLPVASTLDGGEVRSESRLFSSPEVAASECDRMVALMKARLISAGHEVTHISCLEA